MGAAAFARVLRSDEAILDVGCHQMQVGQVAGDARARLTHRSFAGTLDEEFLVFTARIRAARFFILEGA